MTLEQVIERANANYPAIKASQAQQRAAQGDIGGRQDCLSATLRHPLADRSRDRKQHPRTLAATGCHSQCDRSRPSGRSDAKRVEQRRGMG